MIKCYAIANMKGGTGKSSTVASLGVALAELGKRVLILDMDAQGGVSFIFGIDPETVQVGGYDLIMRADILKPIDLIVKTKVEGVDIIPGSMALSTAEVNLMKRAEWDRVIKDGLKGISGYDYILIDTGPSFGALVIASLVAADRAIIPTQTEFLSLRGLKHLGILVDRVKKTGNPNLKTKILRTMSTHTLHSEGIVEELKGIFKGEVYRAIIPRTIRFSEASALGTPLVVYDPDHPAAIAYKNLAKEVLRDA